MISQQTILERIKAYLNHEIGLAELVNWAESSLIEPEFSENADVDLLMDILMYLGAADSRGFPLTWEILSDFMEKLGGQVQVIVRTA